MREVDYSHIVEYLSFMAEEEKDQAGDGSLEVGKRRNSPKTSKNTLIQCKAAYERGDFKSVRELAHRFGLKEFTLHSRINREGWKREKEQLLAKVQSKVESQVLKELTKQDAYLVRLNARSEKYENMLDASVSQLATTPEGVALCEPGDLDTLTRSELRVLEMRKTALKIVPLSQIDVTSGGQNFGSFLDAIARLRNDKTAPKLGAEDLKRVLEAEIVD